MIHQIDRIPNEFRRIKYAINEYFFSKEKNFSSNFIEIILFRGRDWNVYKQGGGKKEVKKEIGEETKKEGKKD